jgi:endonuclease YncB( thermonuclease family)
MKMQSRLLGMRPLIRVLLFTVLLGAFDQAFANTLSGRVVAVADGDTITVLEENHRQHKIRLAGIDAPEAHQPFGNRSRQNLSDLLYAKDVDVNWRKYDRYGRIVGKVMVASVSACPPVHLDCPKTLDAGLAQITVGLAWHYKQYEKEQTEEDRERYGFAEFEARAKHVGLWQDKKPIPPWEWRHQMR